MGKYLVASPGPKRALVSEMLAVNGGKNERDNGERAVACLFSACLK